MRLLIAAALAMIATPAFADDCNIYTSELWNPGVRTIEFSPDGATIKQDENVWRYTRLSLGTGIQGVGLMPVDASDPHSYNYIEHKEDIILGPVLEVFTPYCAQS